MKPRALTVAQVIVALFVGRCLLRVVLSVVAGGHPLPYGMTLGPYWLDVLIAAAAVACLFKASTPSRLGLVAACLPVAGWLLLTAYSSESWRLWHWIVAGFPSGLDGLLLVDFDPPVDRIYGSQMELRGAMVGTFLQQVVFAAVLGFLLFGRASRSYFHGRANE